MRRENYWLYVQPLRDAETGRVVGSTEILTCSCGYRMAGSRERLLAAAVRHEADHGMAAQQAGPGIRHPGDETDPTRHTGQPHPEEGLDVCGICGQDRMRHPYWDDLQQEEGTPWPFAQ